MVAISRSPRRRSTSAALVWLRSRGFALCTEYQTGSIAATRPAQHPCLARQADRCMTACANVSSTPNLGVYGNSRNQSTDWRYNTCTCSASARVIFATFTQYQPGTQPWPGSLARSGCCPRYSPPIDGAQPMPDNAEQCDKCTDVRANTQDP